MATQNYKLQVSDFVAVGLTLFTTTLYFLGTFYDLDLFIKFSGFFLFLSALTLLIFRHKQFVLYALAFLIPMSVPVKLAGGATVQAPTEIIGLLLTVFLFFKLFSGIRLNAAFLKHPISLLILADIAWFFLTSATSEMPLVSFKRTIIKTIYYTGFYFFYFELFSLDKKTIKHVFLLQCLGFIIPIVSALSFHATLGFTTMGSQQAPAPFYYDHTMYGAALAFLIPFLLIFTLQAKSRNELFSMLFLLFVFLIALFLSYSRAAWLSLLLSLGTGMLLKFKINFPALLIMLAVILGMGYANQEKIELLLSSNKEMSHGNDVTKHFKSISNVNTDVSNLERVNRWKCAIRMFKNKPLLGFGPGTYQFFYGNYQIRKDITPISTFAGNKGHAHSEYLNYLSETGLPGLLVFISLLSAVIYTAIKLIRKTKDAFQKNILYSLLLGLLTFAIHGFFNGFIEFDKIAMPVFMSMAAIVAIDISLKNSKDLSLQARS